MSNTLLDTSRLAVGGELRTVSGYSLRLGGSNLEETGPDGERVWHTSTYWKDVTSVAIQDGNLVLLKDDGTIVWQTYTTQGGTGPYRLVLQEDGDSQLIDSTGLVVWNTCSVSELSGDPALIPVATRYAPVVQLDSLEPYRPLGFLEYVDKSLVVDLGTRDVIGVDPHHPPVRHAALLYMGKLGPPTQADATAPLWYRARVVYAHGRKFYDLLYVMLSTWDNG